MTTDSSIALITGGTSGIGRAAANKLAQLGIHVLVVGRNLQRGEKTVAEIRAAGGKADFISSDLRDASSARKVARNQGTVLPRRRTCSAHGEERQRSDRQCIDNGCRLRSVRHEPL